MPLSPLEAIFLGLAMLGYALAGGASAFSVARHRRDPHARANPWLARGLLLGAFAAHAVLLALRGWSLGDHALEDKPSTLLFVAWCATLVGVIIDMGQGLRSLPLFLTPAVLLALAIATVQLVRQPAITEVAVPASARLAVLVHVGTVIVAYGAFAFAAVLSVMYLVLEGQLKKKKLAVLSEMPALDLLERVEGRFVVAGFVLLTVSLAIGFETQRATGALGPDWLQKFVPALVTWAACGGLVGARAASLLAGRRQVFATLAVFALVLITYLGAPLVTGEPHVPRPA
jgi:ABC-type uncharacterized transport system permease subunit